MYFSVKFGFGVPEKREFKMKRCGIETQIGIWSLLTFWKRDQTKIRLGSWEGVSDLYFQSRKPPVWIGCVVGPKNFQLECQRNPNKTRTSKVGAISKAQKAQKHFFGKKLVIFEKKFFQKKSHSAEKCKTDVLTYIQLQNMKKLEGGTFLEH